MYNLLFTLQNDLSLEQQAAVVAQVGTIPGVNNPGPVNPAVTSPTARRFCKAEVADSASLDQTLEKVRSIRGVMSATTPAMRELISPVPGQQNSTRL